ncbi:uncharacterized protein LOC126793447 [Argentina anserina]|uniref:uncharacterized protein LOC126793447 n=1 Tax=Argentina anserina TaxID=57926 RepID=UPI00217652D4|nr:uncharacterized protein LOC126793447 [Potentilla anserina]XP_050375930.1 uncharacterized protein LOC126793447 [Potentilla anserina]XP_050375931.1 uncharacterized protein LOC126793447 [Potentilla anserina]XP_050375932.1 uncharacterized protein LOC126793447 [Potentilla anserina]XP_050375933.1 uncharacterized protein LOC126793447 [Potentilla anserina]
MHCALQRVNSDFQKGADRGTYSYSRKKQSSFRTSLQECGVLSATWRNSDHRCAIFKFLSLEPDGRWKIVTLPTQCTDNNYNLASDALVNMESLHLAYSPPISPFKSNWKTVQKGPPLDVLYSVKSCTNRRFTDSTMRHQSRNKTLVNKATKWNVSRKFQKSLTSGDSSAIIPNDSYAVKSSGVVSNRKVDSKKSSRKKSRKKGKQSKKVLCNVGSTDPDVISEEYGNVSSASETCGNNDGDGPALFPTAPDISLPDARKSETPKTCTPSIDEVGTVSNFENQFLLKNSSFPILDGVEGIHHTKASCCNDLYTKSYSEMHASFILDSTSIGSNSDGSTNVGHDEKHAEREIYNTDIYEPPNSSSRKGYYTRQSSLNDLVNSYQHTEGARQGYHGFSSSSSDMKCVVPNKRSRQNKVGQRTANVPKYGTVGNIRTGKENNHSVWQKVQKNDANDCTGELKKGSFVYSRLDLPLREAPMLNKTCNAVDIDAFLKYENRKQQKDRVPKKVKRRTPPTLKREHKCYSRKGSHASLASSDGSLKLRMDQSDISDISTLAEDKKGSSVVSRSCSRPTCPTPASQSSKVECMNSESVTSMQVCPKEIGHLENVCKTVSGMNDQNVGNEDGSMQKTCDSRKESSLLQMQSPVYLPHLLYDEASQEVHRQISLAESSKQNRSSSGSLTQKWMPVGLKDSESASSTRSENPSLENSDEEAIKRLAIKANVVSEAAVEHAAQGFGDITCSSDDAEGRLPTSNAIKELTNKQLGAANYVNSSDVSKSLNAFEAYSNRVLEAVNNACRAQLASEAVQMITGYPIAEFERLLYYSSPVIHQSPSCNTCCSWNQFDQVGGVSLCRHKTPNVSLGCLWEWYERYGSYGLEVRAEELGNSKRLGADCFTFRAYFVPYLSGIQLFRNGRSTDTGDINNGLHSHEVSSASWSDDKPSKSSSIDSLPIYPLLFSQLDCKENAITPPLDSLPEAFAKDVPVRSADTTDFCDLELLLEYFEYEQPQQRRPLYDKIKELIRGDGNSHSKVYGDPTKLDSINLNDLHPRSWYSVAWYPIYRIPDGNFRAAFLTYHSIGYLVRRSCNFESHSMDDCVVSPVVGLQSYNAQGECWFQLRPSAAAQTIVTNSDPSGILEERLRTLEETASLMARAVVSKGTMTSANRHPDFEFFLSRRR